MREFTDTRRPKGQASEEDKSAVQQAGDEQISEFIRYVITCCVVFEWKGEAEIR